MKNRNEGLQFANTHNILIDQRIIDMVIIRGIYGVFDGDECLYCGRSNDLYGRILKHNGHIDKIRRGEHVNKVMAAVKEKRRIEIRVLEEVRPEGNHPAIEAQRLASRECHWIDEFQRRGQCLEQFPEGVWR